MLASLLEVSSACKDALEGQQATFHAIDMKKETRGIPSTQRTGQQEGRGATSRLEVDKSEEGPARKSNRSRVRS
jgi:hypothetical protein